MRVEQRLVTVVTGTIGADAHIVGTWVLSRYLKDCGLKVVPLGAICTQEEFINAAVESNADAILISSLYGMARLDCEGFREKCVEAGLKDIKLYVGGILVSDPEERLSTKKLFEEELGFNRAYPPETRPSEFFQDLKKDLGVD